MTQLDHPQPHPKAPGLAVGIDREMVTRLVHAFYTEVQRDAVLAPIFAMRVSDWGPHLEKLVRFWCAVALMTGEYHGRPMPAHMGLGIVPEHFTRWLDLFGETANRVCPPDAAAFFIDRAQNIARSLRMGIGLVDPLTGRLKPMVPADPGQ